MGPAVNFFKNHSSVPQKSDCLIRGIIQERKQFFFKGDFHRSPKRDISKVLKQFKGRIGHIWLGQKYFLEKEAWGRVLKNK